MADKNFSVNFAFNGLTQALENQNKINKALVVQEVHHQRISRQLENQLTLTQEQQAAFEKVISKTPLAGIFDMVRGMESFNKAADKLKDLDFGKVLQSQFQKSSDVAVAFGQNLRGIVGQTITGGFKNLAGIVKILGAGFQSLGGTILAIGAPIAVIIAAIFTLRRMWQNNIGGMQTFFFRIVGQLKDVWGKFSIAFDKALRSLSPLFKIIFGAIFLPLMTVLKVVGVLLEGIFIVLAPILDVLKEVGQALLSPFEAFKKSGAGSIDIFKTLGKVIKVPFQVLAAILKVTLLPLRVMAKMIGLVVGIAEKLGEKFLKLRFVQVMFGRIKTAIELVKRVLDALIAPFKFIIEGAEKVFRFLTGSREERAQDIQRALPVTTQQTITQQLANQRQTIYNNNANIAVHASGQLTTESAPRVGNIIASQIGFQAKAL